MLDTLFDEQLHRKEYDEALRRETLEEGKQEGSLNTLIGLVKKRFFDHCSSSRSQYDNFGI